MTKEFDKAVFANISKKLQHLDCTLLGNGEEWWIHELLFTPGIHRFHLLKWILTKLGINIAKVSQLYNSPEEHAKTLLPTLTALGFCQSTDRDLILGNCSKSAQLQFWENLINILYEKTRINAEFGASYISERMEGIGKSECETPIEQCYNGISNMLNAVSTTIDMNELFSEKIDLLPPDVVRDIQKVMKSNAEEDVVSLPDLKASLLKRISEGEKISTSWVDGIPDTSQPSLDIFSLKSSDVEKAKRETASTAKKVMEHAEHFSHFYNDRVQPVLKLAESSSDCHGSIFHDLHESHKSATEILDNISAAKSCYFKLNKTTESLDLYSKTTTDVEDPLSFSSSMLKEYNEALKFKQLEKLSATENIES